MASVNVLSPVDQSVISSVFVLPRRPSAKTISPMVTNLAALKEVMSTAFLETAICRSPDSSRSVMKMRLPMTRCSMTLPVTRAVGRLSISLFSLCASSSFCE